MSKNLMVDIETLAGDTNACVVQIGAIEFDPETQTFGTERLWNLLYDREYQSYRNISGDTVQWWLRQSQGAIDSVLRVPNNERVTPRVAVTELRLLVDTNAYVWARGPSFDLAILNDLYAGERDYMDEAEANRKDLVPYWKWRDERPIRDLIESCGYGMKRRGTHHNALDDAKHQATNVVRAYELMQTRKQVAA